MGPPTSEFGSRRAVRKFGKKRVQLTHAEKDTFLAELVKDPSRERMHALIKDWNLLHEDRPLILTHLLRLSKQLESKQNPLAETADNFWSTIKDTVEAEIAKSSCGADWRPATDWTDRMGNKTHKVDTDKIPFISEADLEALRFPFDLPKYNQKGTPAEVAMSTKLLRHDFRSHLQSKGMVLGAFKHFAGSEEKATPSADGPWKIVGDVVRTHKTLHSIMKHEGTTFGDTGRINPSHDAVKQYLAKHHPLHKALPALGQVLDASEAVYRHVADLMPTWGRADTKWRRLYAINPEMSSSWLSFLTCLDESAEVQLDHMDDHARGAAALWGLVKDQYLVVWLNSYQMNAELEWLHERHYAFAMTKKPAGWPAENFWNLVANTHLRAIGTKAPTPVKVPLPVGDLLLFDFLVVHAGMPGVRGAPSLRGHLYWAQIAGRDGERASEQTCFPWSTYHPFYPAWRVLAEDRRRFC